MRIGDKSVRQLLVLHCCECGVGVDTPVESLPVEKLVRFLAAAKWLVSIVTPPGEEPVRFALLCEECAPRVHPPAVVDLARSHLKKGLS